MSERSAERYDDKAEDKIRELRIAQENLDLTQALKASADESRAASRERKAQWHEQDAEANSRMSPEVKVMRAQLSADGEAELKQAEAKDQTRVDAAQVSLDKADGAATRHYRWHKGAAREAALRDAAESGVEIDAPGAFPAKQPETDQTDELIDA